jgi:hypothetical protein
MGRVQDAVCDALAAHAQGLTGSVIKLTDKRSGE